jgi:hypothetical protein
MRLLAYVQKTSVHLSSSADDDDARPLYLRPLFIDSFRLTVMSGLIALDAPKSLRANQKRLLSAAIISRHPFEILTYFIKILHLDYFG